MVAIQNFLSSIGDAIVTAWEFIVAMFKDFFDFLVLVYKMPVYVGQLLGGWIPPELLTVLLLTVAIVILYKVLGREG